MLTNSRSISMIHARAFSFTDDATSVAIPDTSASSITTSPIGKSFGLDTADTSILFFQLRRIQSLWYQELFRSGSCPFPQDSQYVWSVCERMQRWAKSIPDSIPISIQTLFKLEFFYSSVYCLTPSCRVPVISDIGRALIFEYSIAYVQKIHPISKELNSAFYTYHDALRVYFIGSQFISVLTENCDQLLNGQLLHTTMDLSGPSHPSIPNTSRSDNIDRCIACIGQIIDTLHTYGERWVDSKALKTSFIMQSKSILNELHRRGTRNRNQRMNNSTDAY
jgi:hypothetical protein